MRRWMWTVAGLSLPAVLMLSRGPAGASPQEEAPELAPRAVSSRQAPLPQPRQRSQYEITPQVGPWMILAAHYTGRPAADLAEQAARELRGKSIPAYTFNYADKKRREQEHEFHMRQQRNPSHKPRFTRVEEEVAVLIGGFRTPEAAKNYMDRKVKNLPAPTVRLPDGSNGNPRMLQVYEGTNEKTNGEERHSVTDAPVVNPFPRAFVVRNPAARTDQQAQQNQVDPLWKKLNAKEEFSLLKCKKNYTLVVKYYQGPAVVESSFNSRPKNDAGFLAKIGILGKAPDILEATAAQAHELARYLRVLKLESYVLHTREGSIVTVGSYDRLNDDELLLIRDKLGRLQLPRPHDPADTTFDLMSPPMPMPVPKL